MEREDIIARFNDINIWRRGAQRAPHKPLLILYALGQWVQHGARSLPFKAVNPALKALLVEFGPPRQSYHPEYPFWRLQNDGIWKLEHAEGIAARASNTDAKKSELLRLGVTGGFTDALYDAFARDPSLVQDLAQEILDMHFAETMHQDIRQAVELPYAYVLKKQPARVRDPQFRYRVLVAYEHRCAVCGFDVRMGTVVLGIEAAHIKWHQAGGPDEPENGIALCALHHKLLDRGAYTLTEERVILVSEHAHGSTGFEQWLLRYHGTTMRAPVRATYAPKETYLKWHHREVFRKPARSNDASEQIRLEPKYR